MELKDITQLEGITTSGVSTESYVYDSEGRVFKKTLTLLNRSSYPFETQYNYDTLDRITDVLYPPEYGNGQTQPRKTVHHDYDIASRLNALTVDGQSFASNIIYNAASQTTSLNVGTGANQVTESYNYNAQTGLLDNQTLTRGATTLLDLSYDYLRAGTTSGRTGQLTKILNNLNHNKDRGYSYDALGRLVQATGGVSGALWTQTYAYDRYGNRTSVTASGYSAKGGTGVSPVNHAQDARATPAAAPRERGSSPTVTEGVSVPSASSSPSGRGQGEGAEGLASNPPLPSISFSLPTLNSSLDGKRSHHASKSAGAPTATQSGPVFTDDPLTAGVTIKAVHITELRNEINNARVRANLTAAIWAESVASGVTVKAAHITEMRARLDEARIALGLSAASYTDPGLTVGYAIKAVHIQELRERVRESLASVPIPRDGHASLSYNIASNRITTAGFEYDAGGNQVRALIGGGSGSQRFRYDAANRLVQVRTDDNNAVIASYTYGDSNERLITEEGTTRTYYVSEGRTVTTEYTEAISSSIPSWSKSYVYLGNRLLSTLTPNGGGGEALEYHHPDRLGTRLITNPATGSWSEQVTLPFGTALAAESSGTPSKRRFTSYDRSTTTGLDYAVNRHYDSQQGRFTQVDPAWMKATSLLSPQTLNLYAYCTDDPVNRTDPDGLGLFSFFKKVGKWIAKHWKIVVLVASMVAFAFIGAASFAAGSLNLLKGFVQDPGRVVLSTVWMRLPETLPGWVIATVFGGVAAAALVAVALSGSDPPDRARNNSRDKNNKDPEEPCKSRTADVRRDLDDFSELLQGTIRKNGLFLNQDFPGAVMDVALSYNQVIARLEDNGFSYFENFSRAHWGAQDYKIYMPDGLWYHVDVYRPIEGGIFVNPDAKPPYVTIHCHATNPSGPAHIWDWFKRQLSGQ